MEESCAKPPLEGADEKRDPCEEQQGGNEEADSLANQAHELGNIDDYSTELKELDVQLEKAAKYKKYQIITII